MRYTFLIEAGNVGTDNTQISVYGISNLPSEITLTKEFDLSQPIGKASVFIDEGVVKAEAEIPDYLLDAWPALGIQVAKGAIHTHKDNDSIRVFSNTKIYAIGLCGSPNADENIKSIREQIKKPPTN